MALSPFHVAVAVHDLTEARGFYGELLGCPEGRSNSGWIDFDFYGHQLVCHRADVISGQPVSESNVDGKSVPIPHYGVVLDWQEWEKLANRLTMAGVHFVIKPNIRFSGEPGEQATFFIADPAGNVLEFKAMRDSSKLFSS